MCASKLGHERHKLLVSSSAKTILIPKGHGLRRLLADDPAQFLLFAVEQVQEQAHHRRLARVLRATRRRKQQIGWVHVSDVLQPCDRIVGARLLGYRLPEEKINPRVQRIFDNGHFMHMRWQNYFASLPPSFNVQISSLVRRWPIVGEADLAVQHDHFGKVIVELKSMNTQQFSALKAAQPDHRAQVNMYVGLGGYDHAQVWYENKDNQDIKIFWYPFDTVNYYTVMDRVFSVVEQIQQGRLPDPCGMCNFDDYIGNLKWDDARLASLEAERDRWQNKSNANQS